MYTRHIMTLHCLCCGAPEETGGCVRGPRCDCRWPAGIGFLHSCPACDKCLTHCKCEINDLVEGQVALIEGQLESMMMELERRTEIMLALRQIRRLTRKEKKDARS